MAKRKKQFVKESSEDSMSADEFLSSLEEPKVETKKEEPKVEPKKMEETKKAKPEPKKVEKKVLMSFDRYFTQTGKRPHHKAGMKVFLPKAQINRKRTLEEWNALFSSY